MVTLRPMNELEFQTFLSDSITTYADDKVRAGNWKPSEAMKKSRDDHQKLLPLGLATPNHYLFTIEFNHKSSGRIWLSSDPSTAGGAGFIYDLYIEENSRGQGIATQALRLLEKEASGLGLNKLSLHVFGFNTPAIALYNKLGYEVTNLNMSKDIPPG